MTTDPSPNLALPFIQPAQAQKHVTHNEALLELDRLVQMRIAGFEAETPPAAPELGATYALGPAPTLAWSGQGGAVATWDGVAWQFCAPRAGWRAWDLSEGMLRVYSGGQWEPLDLSSAPVAQLGVGTSADAVNRLAVASEAVLLTHTGSGGHRVKVNKASSGDTASLLFQSNWMGHAEMGLAGDTDFSLKVSPDGNVWTEVMRASPAALQVAVPLEGAAVQADAQDVTPGRLMRADYGYGPGNLLGTVAQAGGIPTGAVLESGSNANGQYVRWADGTQICWQDDGANLAADSASGNVFRSAIPENWVFPASFANDQIFGTAAVDGDSRWAVARLVDNASLNYRQYQGSQSFTLVSTRLFAIGRWF